MGFRTPEQKDSLAQTSDTTGARLVLEHIAELEHALFDSYRRHYDAGAEPVSADEGVYFAIRRAVTDSTSSDRPMADLTSTIGAALVDAAVRP